jgi:hypothetical protein
MVHEEGMIHSSRNSNKTDKPNVEVTGAARLYRAAPEWTAGLGHRLFLPLERAISPAPTFGYVSTSYSWELYSADFIFIHYFVLEANV